MLLIIVLGISSLYRLQDKAGFGGLVWKVMNKGADLQEATVQKRWLIPVLVPAGLALLAVGGLLPSWGKLLSLTGALALILAAFVLWDWLFTWSETHLGRLVRSHETRRYSLGVLTFIFFLWLAELVPAPDGWFRIAERVSLLLCFGGGLWAAVHSVRHSILDTYPNQGEELASFATAILQAIPHHFVTAVLLGWGFLGYLNKLCPRTFVDENGISAGFWLLGNYAVGKLTVSGSSLVKPTPGLGGVMDTLFSVLGACFMVAAVTSLFAVLPRAKAEKKPRK
jgi:hypothetical protein